MSFQLWNPEVVSRGWVRLTSGRRTEVWKVISSCAISQQVQKLDYSIVLVLFLFCNEASNRNFIPSQVIQIGNYDTLESNKKCGQIKTQLLVMQLCPSTPVWPSDVHWLLWWILLLDWLPTLADTSTLHQLFAIFYTGDQFKSGSSLRLLCSPSTASMRLVLYTSMMSAHRWQTFLGVLVCELLIVVTFFYQQLKRILVVEISGSQRLLHGTHFPFICVTELSTKDNFDQGWKPTHLN